MTTTATRPAAEKDAWTASSVARLVSIAVAVGLAVMVLSLWSGDGRPQPSLAGLPDAGPSTDWALPAADVLTNLAGIATVGLLLVGAFLVPTRKGSLIGAGTRCVRAVRWSGGAWCLLGLAQGLLLLSEIVGEPIPVVLEPQLVTSFFLDIDLGRALIAQAVLVVLAAIVATYATTSAGAAIGLVVALAAWLPPTLTTHSGASSDHGLAVTSLMVHVVAITLWCGAVAGAVALVAIDRGTFARAVPRVSALAVWCVVAVGVSGVVNGATRLVSLDQLGTTSYGRLLLFKIIGLVVLIGIGFWHRRRVLPVLDRASRSAFLKIAGLETLVMAAVIGLAVALSRTPPPVNDEISLAGATPARVILGFDLPPEPTISRLLLGEARPDAYALTVGALLIALYLAGLRTLRRRGDSWSTGRTIAWCAGVLVLVLVTSSGVATYARVLFSVHMTEHMVLSMLVPILLVLGAPITLALRTLPSQRDDRGPREWLLSLLHSRPATVLAHPVVAGTIFVASFYVLYFTELFPSLMDGHWGHVAMNTHFVLSGFLFFWVLIGVDPGPQRPPHLLRVVILFAAMPFHAFFSLAVLTSTNVIASAYYTALERPYATDLVADQQLGGGIGWATGEIPILIVLITLFLQWRRSDARESRASDRQSDRAARGEVGGRDEHQDYNDYLEALADPGRHRPVP